MNERFDYGDDRDDPLLERAAAALREHEHARPGGLSSVTVALRHRRPARAMPRAVIGIAAAIVLAVATGALLRFRAPDAATPPGTTLVNFSFDAPTARDVSVVGEFNGWNDRASPMQRNARGMWIASVALEPGRHVYGFHVNGAELVPDPRAPVAPEELFGVRHSVLVVPSGAAY